MEGEWSAQSTDKVQASKVPLDERGEPTWLLFPPLAPDEQLRADGPLDG